MSDDPIDFTGNTGSESADTVPVTPTVPESPPPAQPVSEPVIPDEHDIRANERNVTRQAIFEGLKEVLGATELEAARKVIFNRG